MWRSWRLRVRGSSGGGRGGGLFPGGGSSLPFFPAVCVAPVLDFLEGDGLGDLAEFREKLSVRDGVHGLEDTRLILVNFAHHERCRLSLALGDLVPRHPPVQHRVLGDKVGVEDFQEVGAVGRVEWGNWGPL